MIGIGIIGAGFFGAIHARAIAAVPGAQVAAVCRQDIDAAGPSRGSMAATPMPIGGRCWTTRRSTRC